MQKASLKVNETHLVQNLRFAFTNKSTVLAELMQNGRRAGATEIRFEFDPETETLSVVDNGSGVENMQNLLTIAESGWDQEIKETEHPFGMGFLSALFSATHVTIESRGKKMAFDTNHALDFGDVDVVTSDFIGGARISMAGFSMTAQQIESALTGYARGFAVDTFLNGKLLASPDRECNLSDPRIIPGVGTVKLGQTTGLYVYLQGLKVRERGYDHRTSSIVHLDSKLFYAKMPDRNVLIDESEQIEKISAAISEQWRAIMLAEKAVMPAQMFAEKYWAIARSFGIMDVMNDVPFIASAALSTIEVPTTFEWKQRLIPSSKAVTQAEVESGEVVLCENNASYLDGKNMVASVFAHKQGWLEIETLPAGHWSQAHVRDIDKIEPELQYEVKAQDGFGGCYVNADLIVCDEYRIKVGEEVITVDDLAVVFGEDSDDCTIIVPRKTDGTEALEMASSYVGENDYYNEDSHEEDMGELSNQVSILRGEDPCDTMAKILSEGNIANCRNVLGGIYMIQARASISWGSKDYVVDALSIMDALKSAESALCKAAGNDDGAIEKIRNAIAQVQDIQKSAILDLAKSSLRAVGHHDLANDDETVRYVSAYFAEEIARGNHTLMTVSETVKQAIEAFEGGAR